MADCRRRVVLSDCTYGGVGKIEPGCGWGIRGEESGGGGVIGHV